MRILSLLEDKNIAEYGAFMLVLNNTKWKQDFSVCGLLKTMSSATFPVCIVKLLQMVPFCISKNTRLDFYFVVLVQGY
jgi:hypothetical protein